MEPYQQRIIDERSELESKLQKLDDFLNGGVPMLLSDRKLLDEQAQIMRLYSAVLFKRIDRFNT